MKYISLSLAALFCMSSSLVAEETPKAPETEQVKETNFILGLDFVELVRAQYLEGSHQKFFEQMEKDYQETKKDDGLEGLIAMRKEAAAFDKAHAQTSEQWKKLAQSWTEERNKELLKLIDAKDESVFAQKIRSVAKPLDPSAQEAKDYFSHLKQLSPGEGKNADENFLIESDVESEYKEIHFKSESLLDYWVTDHQEKQLALRMQALDKILSASKHFEDLDLKAKVETFYKFFDAYEARELDKRDLHRLAIGAMTPTSELEKKAAAILSSYDQKLFELNKETLQQMQD